MGLPCNEEPVRRRPLARSVRQGRPVARQFPESGPAREDIAAGLRCFLVKPYVAFYRVAGDTIEILRVIHGHRDAARILREE
jgi:plasmid stabilization system protein ParE